MKGYLNKNTPANGVAWDLFCAFFCQRKTLCQGIAETRRTIAFADQRVQIARAGDWLVWREKFRAFDGTWEKWGDWYFVQKPPSNAPRLLRVVRGCSWAVRWQVMQALGMIEKVEGADLMVAYYDPYAV